MSAATTTVAATAASSRPAASMVARSALASSSQSSFASPSPSSSSLFPSRRHLTSSFSPRNRSRSNRVSYSSHRTKVIAPQALPEATSALDAATTTTLLADVISSLSSSSAAAAAPSTSTSLAASLSNLASVAMMTLAELTNEATSAVSAEEARVASTLAAEVSALPPSVLSSLSLSSSATNLPFPEPANALSLPTWAIHVSSVAEWVVAMNLFWRLGGIEEEEGEEEEGGSGGGGLSQWRGMSWGMTPLLGGALCACTFHFFYNSPRLAPLVALQAGLTVVGNATMWYAAYRVYKATEGRRAREDAAKQKENV